MKQWIILLGILYGASINATSLLGQTKETSNSVVLGLIVKDDTIGHLDVIEYTVSLSNNGGDTIITEPWSLFHQPFLEYRFDKDSIWKILLYSDRAPIPNPPWSHYSYEKPINFDRNSTIEKKIRWAPFFEKKEFTEYSSHEEMFIRAKVFPFGSGYLVSNEILISFVKYEDIGNREAYRWLLAQEVPGFIYERIVYGSYSWGLYSMKHLETKEYAEELIHNFPKTAFADWARLHLALFYYHGILEIRNYDYVPDYEKAKQILAEIENADCEYLQKIRQLLLDEMNYDPFRE